MLCKERVTATACGYRRYCKGCAWMLTRPAVPDPGIITPLVAIPAPELVAEFHLGLIVA